MKLDTYDKKILEILLNNSREHVTKIAKKVRLRRENVNYKINRLIELGLIKEFITIFDEQKLNVSHYTIFLQLTNLQENTETKILDYLNDDPYSSWIGTSAGKWSLTYDIIIPNKIELESIIKKFFTKFGKYIDDYVLLNLQEGDYFNYKFLGLREPKKIKKSENNNIKLDKKDLKILSLLNQNSRTNYVEISDSLKLTPNAIIKRVKNLEKQGIIQRYTISINWKKLGFEWHGLQLELTNFNQTIENKLINYLKNHPKVIFYYKYLGGSWDYDIGMMAKNSEELRDFIHEFRKKFSDDVKISDIFLVLEESDSYKLPKGVFNS